MKAHSEAILSRKVTAETIAKLESIVGKDNVNTSDMEKILYSHDLAPLPKVAGIGFKNIPDVVVRPETDEQISKVVSLAYESGIPIVPRGNATWGLGGCMPTNAGIVVDMASKMNKIIEINTESMYIKVQAGCTWKKALDECMKLGFIIGSYPSSFPAATIGAWTSTDGMGTGSYKYGSSKDNTLNMKVVLSDGTLIETGYDHIGSYMAGYNLNQFFAGSEGTLGIMTTITLRIYPMGEIRPMAFEFENLKEMHEPIQEIINHPSIKPLHIAWSDYLHFANQRIAGVHDMEVKNVMLVTIQGDSSFLDFEEKQIDEIIMKYAIRKLDSEVAAHEWEERCYEFRARKAGVGEIPAEVIVPAKSWGDFVDECYDGFKTMRMQAGGVIGVIVDRSTALFMPYYFKDDETLLGMAAFSFNFYIGDRAMLYGGRTTGFGVFFAWNMDVIHDGETADFMRDLKTALDPRDVMNPGHLVCGKTRFGIEMSKNIMSFASTLIQGVKKLLPEDTIFTQNLKRFRYDDMDHKMTTSRDRVLGEGSE
ncbi:MAG TPA: FAD-binding oxidoreductase [Candidatus Methanomethylophilaceae archaeon]|nr:FAD-binding oxidoreductase [Candidatus Methanomethylophilaceae archaeon]